MPPSDRRSFRSVLQRRRTEGFSEAEPEAIASAVNFPDLVLVSPPKKCNRIYYFGQGKVEALAAQLMLKQVQPPPKAPLCLDSMINTSSSLQPAALFEEQWMAPLDDDMSNIQQHDLEQAVIAGFEQFQHEPIYTESHQSKFQLQLDHLILPGVIPRTMDDNFQSLDEYYQHGYTEQNCNEEILFSPGASPCNHYTLEYSRPEKIQAIRSLLEGGPLFDDKASQKNTFINLTEEPSSPVLQAARYVQSVPCSPVKIYHEWDEWSGDSMCSTTSDIGETKRTRGKFEEEEQHGCKACEGPEEQSIE